MPTDNSYNERDTESDQRFDALVEAHYAGLFRFAMTLTRAEDDASDLVQETFLTWATKGGQLRDQSKARTWLFTTLHRHFLETQRRKVRRPQVELEEAEQELDAVVPELADRLDAAQLVEMLAQLDEQYRAAVVLFYLEESSYEAIAEVLQIPLGTVKSRISRGISQLKNLVLQAARLAERTRRQ